MQLLKTQSTLSSLRHDGQLLYQFAAKHDETAFVEILRRHGAMVLGVCRRVLHQQQDAEDATQAVFLSLAQQASKLAGTHSLAAWLHCVARRTAGHALRQAQKRQRREHQAARPEAITAHDADAVRWLLDEELDRLPQRYRLPIILCCIEGHTRHTAADLLGWPPGTVAGRLARARAILQKRLTARGVALAATTGVLMPCVGQGMDVALFSSIASLANQWIQGKELMLSPTVLGLMHVTGSVVTGSRMAMLALLGLFGLLGWISAHRISEQPVESNPEQPIISPVSAMTENDRTDVEGTVLADGKPAAGVTVWLTETQKGGKYGYFDQLNDTTKTDDQGRFIVRTLRSVRERTSLAIFARSEEGRFSYHSIKVSSTTFLPLTKGNILNLKPIMKAEGRIRNHRGEPMADVIIKTLYLQLGAFDPKDEKRISRNDLCMMPDCVQPFWTIRTDSEGRFTFPAFPKDCSMIADLELPGGETVQIHWTGESFADIMLPEMGQALIRFKGVEEPEKIKNIVFYLKVMPAQTTAGLEFYSSQRITGAKGLERRVTGLLAGKGMELFHCDPETCAYYTEQKPDYEIKAGETTVITLEMKPSVKVVGSVIDVTTQKGVAGAYISFRLYEQPNYPTHLSSVTTNKNGLFERYRKPGKTKAILDGLPNNLVVDQSPSGDFIGRAGETVIIPPWRVKPGMSIVGEVVTTDGHPVPNAILESYHLRFTSNQTRRQPDPVTNDQGQFQLHQLKNEVIALYVNSPLGVTAEPVLVDLTKTNQSIRITVDPKNAGCLKGRLIDEQGKPLAGIKTYLLWTLKSTDIEPETSIGLPFYLEPTDADGRFRSMPLFPGQQYQLTLSEQQVFQQIHMGSFQVEAGQTLDLATMELRRKTEKK